MFDFLFNNAKYRESPGCDITVGDQKISDLYQYVTEVAVDAARDHATSARLTFTSPVDDDGYWPVTDSGILSVGEKVKLEAVFGVLTEPLFVGYISDVQATYPQNRGQTTVTVTCQDETISLDQVQNRTTWPNPNTLSDGQIAALIAVDHGLKPHPDNADGLTSANLVQSESDIQFLRRRAQANGFEVFTRDGLLYFGPLRLSGESQHDIMVYAGRQTNCLSFTVSNDVHRADKISYDIAAETESSVEAFSVKPDLDLLGAQPAKSLRAAIGESNYYLSRTGTPSQAEAEAYAQGIADRESMRVNANGELDGALYGHVLKTSELVTVQGAGEMNSGRYYVNTVSHKITTEGYRQTFALIRNGIGDDGELAGGLLNAVMGA